MRLPNTGWATPDGDLTPKVFVFELADKSEITRLAFDTAQAENPGRGAKDFTVEISDRKDGGFTEIAKASLDAAKDGQKFALKAPATGRYLKLTVLNNWGDAKYIELMDFYAYGKPLAKRPLIDNSGAFFSSYGTFHVKQTGATVDGCYEHGNGLIESGGFDGRVLRFTWTEGEVDGPRHGGPAIMIFTDDGQSFLGYWWNAENAGKAPSGDWVGKRISKEIGACPHWKPGTSNDVVQQIKSQGRARPLPESTRGNCEELRRVRRPAPWPRDWARQPAVVLSLSSDYLIDSHRDLIFNLTRNLACLCRS
jgi:F5/8 type C domain-containing protein